MKCPGTVRRIVPRRSVLIVVHRSNLVRRQQYSSKVGNLDGNLYIRRLPA